MIKAVLFDLDGTLVNSIYDIADAMNAALHSLGQRGYDTHQYYQMVGNGMKKLCERALEPRAQALAGDLLERYRAEYLARCCDRTRVYEGVPLLLSELKARGLRLGVITNKPADQAQKVTDALLPGAPLDVIWGQQPPFAVKPDPEVYDHVAGLLGVRREETVYVGDSDVDIRFAHNAGARGVGCLWGFRSREELEGAGADLIAERPGDILRYLDGL